MSKWGRGWVILQRSEFERNKNHHPTEEKHERKWNEMKANSWLVLVTCRPTFELQTSFPDRCSCIPEWRIGRTLAWRALPCGIWDWTKAKSCQRFIIFDTSVERNGLKSNSKVSSANIHQANMKQQTGCDAAADHQIPLEIVHTLFSHPILEGTHALDHLTFHLWWAVNVINWQEVLRN